MTAADLPPWELPEKALGPNRLHLAGDAVLDQPELPPAVWGRDKEIAWASGQGTMIASQQGLGKSTIAQQLVLHRIGVRSGDLLGMPVAPLPEGRRVVYLAMDRPMQIKQSIRRMITSQDRDLMNDRMVIWDGPLPFNLLHDPLRFAGWLQEVCPDVGDVVVDSVKDMVPGVSKDEVGAALNQSWQEVIARGIELLLLHHQRKAQQGTSRVNALDDVYGSTWLTSGLGSVFALDGDPGAQVVTVKHLKPVIMQLDDTDVRHDHGTGTTTLHVGEGAELKDVLIRAGEAGVTAVEAADQVIGATGTTEQAKMRRELNKMKKDGSVEKIPGTRTSAGATPDRWRLSPEMLAVASLNG